MNVQMSQCCPSVHVQCFPHQKGKQMIVMSFSDVTNIMLMHRGRGYIRRACTSLKPIIWGFQAKHSGNLLRSQQPSVVAASVPLVEQEYIPTGECSSFIHLHVPKDILDTLS